MNDNPTDKLKENLHRGHRKRLKERFLKDGLNSFEPHNVLELVLFFAIPRKDTNEIAHDLINHFGSVAGTFDADYEDLKSINGISDQAACLLKLIPELARIYSSDNIGDIKKINSVDSAGRFFLPRFIGYTDEHIIIASLDSKGCVIGCNTIAVGTVNHVNISVRAVVEMCMKNRAAAAIMAHNHPNGVPVPSDSDVETTWQIVNALNMVDIRLLDHIIVAGNDYISMRESRKYNNIFSSRNDE